MSRAANEAIAEGVKKVARGRLLVGRLRQQRCVTPRFRMRCSNGTRSSVDGRENLLAVVASEMERHRYYSTQEKMALFLVGRSLGAGRRDIGRRR